MVVPRQIRTNPDYTMTGVTRRLRTNSANNADRANGVGLAFASSKFNLLNVSLPMVCAIVGPRKRVASAILGFAPRETDISRYAPSGDSKSLLQFTSTFLSPSDGSTRRCCRFGAHPTPDMAFRARLLREISIGQHSGPSSRVDHCRFVKHQVTSYAKQLTFE